MGETKEVFSEDDAEFEKELAKVGTGRGKLRKKLVEDNPDLKQVFEEQTPEQKAWGHLIGKLMLAKSNEQVEDAFTWFSVENNGKIELRNQDKAMAFFHAVASIGCDDAHYRILRRMYIRANTAE